MDNISNLTREEFIALMSEAVFIGLKLYGEYMSEEVEDEEEHLSEPQKEFISKKYEAFLQAHPVDENNANLWLLTNFARYPELKEDFLRKVSKDEEKISVKYIENDGRIIINSIIWNI